MHDTEKTEHLSQSTTPSKGLAITSLVLGILSVLLAILWFVSIPAAIVAFVLGIVYLVKNKAVKGGKGMAIAGIVLSVIGVLISLLIFALVFLALPALQEGQRDTSRRNDVAVVASNISLYQTENRGALPEAESIDTSNLFTITKVASNGEPTQSTAIYEIGVDCEGMPAEGSYSLSIKLESGDLFCVDY